MVALKKWHFKTAKITDIQSAFLQSSQIKRPIYLILFKVFRKENNIWNLNKPIHGLNDAERQWYFSVTKVLLFSAFS